MLTDVEISQSIDDGDLSIEPFSGECLQPASYDFRVGDEAYVSGADGKVDVANRGLVIIEPGEFAVITTRERVKCGAQVAGQLGLCSAYARHGLTVLSGPQIDPGFEGVLIVRVSNLAPHRITLAYEGRFLTTSFFKLSHPVAHPYRGSRQGQTGLGPKDIEGLSNPESPTMGGMVKSLTSLARDVSELKGSVSTMTWAIGIAVDIMAIAITIVGVIAALK
jgi:dCTP deaminase